MKTISKRMLVAVLATGMSLRVAFAADLDLPVFMVSQEAELVRTEFTLNINGVHSPSNH